MSNDLIDHATSLLAQTERKLENEHIERVLADAIFSHPANRRPSGDKYLSARLVALLVRNPSLSIHETHRRNLAHILKRMTQTQTQQIADSDIVVTKTGRVVKDRWGGSTVLVLEDAE